MTDEQAASPTEPTPAATNEQAWAIMAHLSPMVVFLLIPGPVGPLGVWLIKRGKDAFVAQQAKASLNFALSVWLCGAPFLLLGFVFLASEATFLVSAGRFLHVLFSLWIGASLLLGIVGAVQAAKGKSYNYPFAWNLVK